MNAFQMSQLEHKVLTQFHRWYQVYEVPFTDQRILNQADILSDDIEIISMAGTTRGKSEQATKLRLFDGWQNAHHVLCTDIQPINDEEASLEAEILYENIRPDGSQHCYKIHYTTKLQCRADKLPLFKTIQLTPIEAVEPFRFDSAYELNRVTSLVHYWLYLLESGQTQADALSEVLADSFEMNWSSGSPITSLEQLMGSLEVDRKAHKAVAYSLQKVERLKSTEHAFQVHVSLLRETVSLEGVSSITEVHQDWWLEDDRNERFARIKKMK